MKNFFYPKSICIAGASSKEKSIGYEILNSIKQYGYTGKIYPVNPKVENVLGYKCYKSIKEIEASIDLAIVVVPKKFVEETIDELLFKGVKSIILITAGFKETGSEGEEAEKRIANKVRNNDGRLIGPNCMGVINTFGEIKLNATFVAEKPETGSTAFLSQSGAIGAAVLNSLRDTDIRFGHFISIGNKADVSENDLLKFWQNDEKIKAITLYLESFSKGEEFIHHFIDGGITKPVIILKAGRTKSGMKAASSHTGALAANDKVVDSVLSQFGIIRVDDLNELFNMAKGFENFPAVKGSRTAVITNAGGPAILAVDALEKEGLTLAELSDETKIKLKGIVHPEGSVNNPIDLLPGGTAEQFKSVNEILINDENVDAVITIFVEPVMVNAFDVIEKLNSIESAKPIFKVVMPLPEFWNEYREKSLTKIPLFRNPEDPSKVISNLLFYHNRKKQRRNYLTRSESKRNFRGNGFLDLTEIKGLLSDYNLPLMNELLIQPEENIENFFRQSEIKFPLVVKGISQDVIHKTELDAVKLNIKNKDELVSAMDEIKRRFSENNTPLEKFLIQPFIHSKYELLLGGFRDPSFGPIVMFGSGGKYVEVIKDTSMRSANISDEDIDEMISETKAGKILRGVRNELSADIPELKRIIKASAQMMIDNRSISEFDINPLILSDNNRFYAVDVRVKISH